MIYVSLPVHTQPGVVAGQLSNIAAFFPEAQVVLHVSANARFTMPELETALSQRHCRNALINPQRLATGWGGILGAHLSNIAWIRRHASCATQICLHASNDMLVRPGVARLLAPGRNFLNDRAVRPGSYWRFANAAMADPALHTLRARLNGAPVIASQLEGACYEAALLFEIADLVASASVPPMPAGYPREEVWLPTLAHALRAEVSGCPYIYSEIHRFDRVFWKVLQRVDPWLGRPGDPHHLPRRALEYAMIKSGFHRITRSLVERIARGELTGLKRAEFMSDGNNEWRVYDAANLYGVKRVPRRPDAPLRAFIDLLAPARLPLEGGCV
ncbi:MAG: hypothetical protein V4723_19720 [Pseudomonadota bacterium]